jgi:hypothetical protein
VCAFYRHRNGGRRIALSIFVEAFPIVSQRKAAGLELSLQESPLGIGAAAIHRRAKTFRRFRVPSEFE